MRVFDYVKEYFIETVVGIICLVMILLWLFGCATYPNNWTVAKSEEIMCGKDIVKWWSTGEQFGGVCADAAFEEFKKLDGFQVLIVGIIFDRRSLPKGHMICKDIGDTWYPVGFAPVTAFNRNTIWKIEK